MVIYNNGSYNIYKCSCIRFTKWLILDNYLLVSGGRYGGVANPANIYFRIIFTIAMDACSGGAATAYQVLARSDFALRHI